MDTDEYGCEYGYRYGQVCPTMIAGRWMLDALSSTYLYVQLSVVRLGELSHSTETLEATQQPPATSSNQLLDVWLEDQRGLSSETGCRMRVLQRRLERLPASSGRNRESISQKRCHKREEE